MTASAQPPTAYRDVVADAVRLVAAGGPQARTEVLQQTLRAAPQLLSLVLRTTQHGDVLAAASRSLPAPRPAPDDCWVLEVPVRAAGSTYAVLTAVSVHPLDAADARMLGAIADLLGLSATSHVAPAEAARMLLDVEADFALLATDIDESLGEALVALRHTDAAKLSEAVTAALSALRRVRRDLRATALHDGLAAALHELAGAGVRVHAVEAELAGVTPPVAVLVERVAEALCRHAVGPVQITATTQAQTVKLTVTSADNAIDANELERWQRRVRALRGELVNRPGSVELHLPLASGDEGHHDHRPDL